MIWSVESKCIYNSHDYNWEFSKKWTHSIILYEQCKHICLFLFLCYVLVTLFSFQCWPIFCQTAQLSLRQWYDFPVTVRKSCRILPLCITHWYHSYPDSKVHGANVGHIWGRQDPGGPHIGHMNLAIGVHGSQLEEWALFLRMQIPRGLIYYYRLA